MDRTLSPGLFWRAYKKGRFVGRPNPQRFNLQFLRTGVIGCDDRNRRLGEISEQHLSIRPQRLARPKPRQRRANATSPPRRLGARRPSAPTRSRSKALPRLRGCLRSSRAALQFCLRAFSIHSPRQYYTRLCLRARSNTLAAPRIVGTDPGSGTVALSNSKAISEGGRLLSKPFKNCFPSLAFAFEVTQYTAGHTVAEQGEFKSSQYLPGTKACAVGRSNCSR